MKPWTSLLVQQPGPVLKYIYMCCGRHWQPSDDHDTNSHITPAISVAVKQNSLLTANQNSFLSAIKNKSGSSSPNPSLGCPAGGLVKLVTSRLSQHKDRHPHARVSSRGSMQHTPREGGREGGRARRRGGDSDREMRREGGKGDNPSQGCPALQTGLDDLGSGQPEAINLKAGIRPNHPLSQTKAPARAAA